jgi:hypothetical protein
MFQVLDRFLIEGVLQDDDPAAKKVPANGEVVIDDQLKTQYAGIVGITVWTPKYEDLRQIDIELKIDSKEVFPKDFPTEIFSVNPYRNVDDCTMKVTFPAQSKIEGKITNRNATAVPVKIILFVKF